jgi:hypothetical protein
MVPSFVDDDPTLLACCLVSRTFLRIAKPRLYASLHIYIQSDTPGSGYYSMPPPTHPLFMRLSAEPDLGALVQQITFLVEFVGDEEEPGSIELQQYPEDGCIDSAIHPVLRNLVNLGSFDLNTPGAIDLQSLLKDLRKLSRLEEVDIDAWSTLQTEDVKILRDFPSLRRLSVPTCVEAREDPEFKAWCARRKIEFNCTCQFL